MNRALLAAALALAIPDAASAETYTVGTWNYRRTVKQLEAGDTLILEAGDYHGMPEIRLQGRPDAWIVIKGPDSGEPARILPTPGNNTIEIRASSYVAIENLTIDGDNQNGIFAVSASGEPSHDIRIENCTIVGHGASQATVAISTKVTVWNWTIRRNRVVGAGTGMYLGDSDGNQPFIAGLIEYNLFLDSRGYNTQIKHQNRRPEIPGMPTTPQRTIVRHNVFLKKDLPSDSGFRPNLLIGALPSSGPGSEDLYEVYGNLFYHNDDESLIQAEGRVTIHDNVFVDCKGDAIHFQNHHGKIVLAHAYNNTFYNVGVAVRFVHPPAGEHLVLGNLMFSQVGIEGPCTNESNNLHVPVKSASNYVRNPSMALGKMDFYPLPGKCSGDALDLSPFAADTESGRDFNGTTKDFTYRGAYSGEGTNPGWQLDAVIKGDLPPAANDRTPPTGTLKAKATTATLVVDLEVQAADSVAGMGEGAMMRFSNNGADWSEPEPYAARKTGWDLSTLGGTKAAGLKVVYARVCDAAGNWSAVMVAAIEYQPASGS